MLYNQTYFSYNLYQYTQPYPHQILQFKRPLMKTYPASRSKNIMAVFIIMQLCIYLSHTEGIVDEQKSNNEVESVELNKQNQNVQINNQEPVKEANKDNNLQDQIQKNQNQQGIITELNKQLVTAQTQKIKPQTNSKTISQVINSDDKNQKQKQEQEQEQVNNNLSQQLAKNNEKIIQVQQKTIETEQLEQYDQEQQQRQQQGQKQQEESRFNEIQKRKQKPKKKSKKTLNQQVKKPITKAQQPTEKNLEVPNINEQIKQNQIIEGSEKKPQSPKIEGQISKIQQQINQNKNISRQQQTEENKKKQEEKQTEEKRQPIQNISKNTQQGKIPVKQEATSITILKPKPVDYFLYNIKYISSFVIDYVSQFIKFTFPISMVSFSQQILYRAIDQIARQLIPLMRNYYHLYKILTDTSKPKTKKVYYEINYANLYGGAKIIMKSSPKIKSINSILEDGTDKYMYTDQNLPLKIIVGLNQEIAIDSIIIQSYEMYSCITKQFKVEGKFTLGDKKWVHLGTFKAENIFGDQTFYLQRKIVRYIKLTIFSSYGKWSYFTLTQIKIRGKNLFADALTDKNSPPVTVEDHQHLQSQSHKQQQQDRPSNTCQNQIFKPISLEPQQSNLITSLITKIDNLQNKNTGQGKQIQSLYAKLSDLTVLLSNKTQQNIIYEKLLNQYKQESGKTFYVIMFSLFLSAITLCSLFCLCWIRRKELIQLNKYSKSGIKKSNSFD